VPSGLFGLVAVGRGGIGGGAFFSYLVVVVKLPHRSRRSIPGYDLLIDRCLCTRFAAASELAEVSMKAAVEAWAEASAATVSIGAEMSCMGNGTDLVISPTAPDIMPLTSTAALATFDTALAAKLL
jgi:hypothetical protein